MIRNYFTSAYRNLIRNKVYSIINISGLAIGIGACLLLFLVVRYELSYDNFWYNKDRIYHIYCEDKYPDGVFHNPGIPFPALDALRADFPNIKSGSFYSMYGNQVTISENGTDKKFLEDAGIFMADPELFEIFSFKWLARTHKILAEPNNMVLCKSLAEKYFGDWHSAIGKTLKLDNAIVFKIAGIVEDVPTNSDFKLKAIGSMITLKNNPGMGYMPEWGATTSNFQVYLSLPPGMSEADFEKQLLVFSKKHYANKNSNERINLIRPLADMHFDTGLGNIGNHVMSKPILLTISMVGFLIIVMACINFVNLSTAQAVGRSREVGVRKVLGGNRRQLFLQMLSETHLLVLLSALLGVLLAIIALPYLKNVAPIEEDLSFFNLEGILFLIITILIVTVLAGLYPSFVISGFQPAVALKNKISSAAVGGISLRRLLVVLQFVISQILIIGTIIGVSQIDFIRNADLGFNTEAILLLASNSDSVTQSRQASFKAELLRLPEVKSVSFASDVPSSDNNSATNFAFDHKPDEDFSLYLKFADEDYFKTFGLQFLAGTGYSHSDTATDVVVNETLLKKLNVASPDAAIGKTIRTGGSRWRRICGVVKDFKTNSLKEEIKPTMISARKKIYMLTCLKLNTTSLAKAQANIQKKWNEFFPEYVYSSGFMDENIERFYEQETKMTLLYKIFAGLAIFISCLGLYGLVSFMVVQKTKEVGIRKVLGAGIRNIVYLFSKEFTLLIAISFVIAAPLGYYLMDKWLSDFTFRVEIGIGVFVIAVLLSLALAWTTVGYKAIKAAIANPVKSLRTE